MTYLKDVICNPYEHVVLFVTLAVLGSYVTFLVWDARLEGWRQVRPLRDLLEFASMFLLVFVEYWKTLVVAVVGVIVVYALLSARDHWCRDQGRCHRPAGSVPRSF